MYEESLVLLLILLASMLFASYLLHFLLDRFRMPSLLAPLLVGFAFQLIPIPSSLTRVASGEPYYILSQLGIMFLLFLIGLQLDVKELRSLSGHIAALSVLNLGLSAILGFFILNGFGYPPLVSILVATALATVAETTIAPILDELGIIRTNVANLILCPGIVDDVAEVAIASLASVMVGSSGASIDPTFLAFGFLAFLSLALLFQKVVLPIIVRYDDRPRDPHLFLLLISTMLLFTFVSQYFRLGLLLGAIVAGMISQKLVISFKAQEKALNVLKSVAYGFLGPIFFFGVGLSTAISGIASSLTLTLLLLAANFVGKFSAALIVGRMARLSLKVVAIIGLGLSAKFSMGIIPVQIFLSAGVIDQRAFSAFIAVSAITTMIVPFALAYGVERWRKELTLEA